MRWLSCDFKLSAAATNYRWIGVHASPGVPETDAEVGGGGGEECRDGLTGATSSYSALTRATASELRVNRSHMSSIYNSWNAIRHDLARFLSGQLVK